MMDKPKRFFECLLPVSVCNIKCPYCYIIQENRRDMKLAQLQYSPEYIARALRPSRVGGICWISICGLGETLAQKEIVDIVYYLLKEGHYINVTTNGTLTNVFNELINRCHDYTNRLHFSFSFHFTELKRKNLLDTFFNNICFVRENGASILYQMNLCDEYISCIEEIKRISIEKLGAYPQVALTRNEKTHPFSIFTTYTDEDYYKIGSSFNSPLFEFTYNNFNIKRKEFCYAGDWSFVLNLQTGWLQKCYANSENGQNIFEDIESKINFEAVGNNCKNSYCVNSSHFLSLGVIPERYTPTYFDLRSRKEASWYSKEMTQFLNHKLNESNREYSKVKKYFINKKYKPKMTIKKLKRKIRKIIK